MKLCVAQLRPVAGNIQSNVVAHVRLIELAVSNGAEIVVFPELSITGYDRALARDLAIEHEDRRIDVFQTISDARQITIGIGVPTKHCEGVCISLMLFQPNQSRTLYSKMHLHSSEEACFVPGQTSTGLVGSHSKIALAICYEVSVPEHAANAFRNGASVYMASVACTVGGIEKEHARLSEIAREYSMTVLMANCIGRSESWEWAGRTAAWNSQGTLLSQLDVEYEGIIMIDTETQDVVQRTIGINAASHEVPSASPESLPLTFRECTSSDIDQLAEWNHQLIRDEGHRNRMTVPQLADRMRGWLEQDYRAIVFEVTGSPVAYALFRDQPDEIYLRQLFVVRERRRQGIGRQAVELLRTRIWPTNKRLTVEVLTANMAAVAFWRSVGYVDYSLMLEILPPG